MKEELRLVRQRMQDRAFDLRDVGELLTGKWDQDFPAALLEAAAMFISSTTNEAAKMNVAAGPWLPEPDDERLAYETAMRQWESSLKRPDLDERHRVRGAVDAFLRQLIACEIIRANPPMDDQP